SIDGLKPCANVMYESLTDSAFDEIVCVVLTGMGAAGTKGIETLKKSGKHIYVIRQDEKSCVVYGMPRSIYEAGMSDEVKSLSKIAESINKKVGVR
uniref:chemotaxis protein CheB n=1 Tax=Eshraghiella crossota TaxID=45851 RepID=UPI0040261F8C